MTYAIFALSLMILAGVVFCLNQLAGLAGDKNELHKRVQALREQHQAVLDNHQQRLQIIQKASVKCFTRLNGETAACLYEVHQTLAQIQKFTGEIDSFIAAKSFYSLTQAERLLRLAGASEIPAAEAFGSLCRWSETIRQQMDRVWNQITSAEQANHASKAAA